MTTMERYIALIGDLHQQLVVTHQEYVEAVDVADMITRCANTGKLAFIPAVGDSPIMFELDAATRELVMQKLAVTRANTAVSALGNKLGQLHTAVVEAVGHIESAARNAGVADIKPQTVTPAGPSQAVLPSKLMTHTITTEAATPVPAGTVPPRVRRIVSDV